VRNHIYPGLLILLFSITACASSATPTSSTDSIGSETSDEECYCSVRKRQQVEDRLKKKKEAGAE
jgi:hypothetical protein